MTVDREIDISIASLIARTDDENVKHVDTFTNEDKDQIVKMWKINGNTYREIYERKKTKITLP